MQLNRYLLKWRIKILRFFIAIKIPQDLYLLIIAFIIGLGGGYGAIIFRKMISVAQLFFFSLMKNLLQVDTSYPYLLPLIPAIGGLLVGLIVNTFAREAKGHGVPEVMDSVITKSGVIRSRIVAVKSIASAICIGSGGSVGREGPIVQIGSALGSVIGQFFKLTRDRMRILVGCGAAAGIAATFNAPLAGAVFSLEIILGDFKFRTFSPIILSSVVATAISRNYLGSMPAFKVPEYMMVSSWELLLYMVMGLLAGLVAVGFVRTLYSFEDLFDNLKKVPEYLKPAIGGMLIGTIGIFYPQIFGVGYETINFIIFENPASSFLLIIFLLKPLATSITLGSGGSGGIFAPSLFLGAAFGGLFGKAANYLFPQITAPLGAYILVGMGVLVASTTHGPLTAMLILFELTDNYRIILPLMLGCIISSLTAKSLKEESIYTLKLLRRGLRVTMGRSMAALENVKIKDIIKRDYIWVNKCLAVEAWKPVIILAGGLIEALLLDSLLINESKAKASSRTPRKKKDLKEWNLGELLDVGVDIDLIN
ncbi:MAG: chloride channel protein, partial [Fidelibacterota bacterium]